MTAVSKMSGAEHLFERRKLGARSKATGTAYDHVDFPATAHEAHQPLAPLRDRGLGAVSLRLLGGIGLDLMVAFLAPDDEAHASLGGVAERHG